MPCSNSPFPPPSFQGLHVGSFSSRHGGGGANKYDHKPLPLPQVWLSLSWESALYRHRPHKGCEIFYGCGHFWGSRSGGFATKPASLTRGVENFIQLWLALVWRVFFYSNMKQIVSHRGCHIFHKYNSLKYGVVFSSLLASGQMISYHFFY